MVVVLFQSSSSKGRTVAGHHEAVKPPRDHPAVSKTLDAELTSPCVTMV
jgi:hypothetical protein